MLGESMVREGLERVLGTMWGLLRNLDVLTLWLVGMG